MRSLSLQTVSACVQKAVKGAKVVGEIVKEPGVWLRDIEIT